MKKRPISKEYAKALNITILIQSILKEVEQFVHDIVKDNVDVDDLEFYYVKADLSSDNALYNVRIHNEQTKTTVIKSYVVLDLVMDCKNQSLEIKLNYDIRDMIIKSNQKVHKDVTEVYI